MADDEYVLQSEVDRIMQRVAHHRYQPGEHGGCEECGLTERWHLHPVLDEPEVCPECLRPVGHSDFGAPCTPVDCDYRAAHNDGSDHAD